MTAGNLSYPARDVRPHTSPKEPEATSMIFYPDGWELAGLPGA
jgi:hypothetical protein